MTELTIVERVREYAIPNGFREHNQGGYVEFVHSANSSYPRVLRNRIALEKIAASDRHGVLVKVTRQSPPYSGLCAIPPRLLESLSFLLALEPRLRDNVYAHFLRDEPQDQSSLAYRQAISRALANGTSFEKELTKCVDELLEQERERRLQGQ